MNWKWTKKRGQGYLTCEAASKQFRYAALADAKVIQFAHPIEADEQMHVKVLTEEGVQRKLIPHKTLKLKEIGRGLQLPQDYILPRSYDPENPVQRFLIRQLANTFDHCSMAALKQGSTNVITSATALMNVIRGAKWTGIEALCSTISGFMCSRAEPYDRTHYVGIGGVKFFRAVKRHPKYIPWQKYLKEGDELFNAEGGATNNIRWIELPDISLLKNEAVVFGHQGLLLKEVQTPNFRFSEGVIAWYGLLAFIGQNVLHVPERKRRWA